MALSYKKDLDKYKDLDEDEILNKLSAEELKQLETALEEMDPEVRARCRLEELQGSSVGGSSFREGVYWNGFIGLSQNKKKTLCTHKWVIRFVKLLIVFPTLRLLLWL